MRRARLRQRGSILVRDERDGTIVHDASQRRSILVDCIGVAAQHKDMLTHRGVDVCGGVVGGIAEHRDDTEVSRVGGKSRGGSPVRRRADEGAA